MAGRPRKNKVDHFPHQCKHGDTIMILQAKFRVEGYSTWFKLLEKLGDTEGHYLDFTDETKFEAFVAYSLITPERCIEILDLLAKLKAIDSKLWRQNRIVWSDNFLIGIAPIYKYRGQEIPAKPNFTKKKSKDSSKKSERSGVSSIDNTQRKEVSKEVSKGSEKGKEIGAKAPSPDYKIFVTKWFEFYEENTTPPSKPRFTQKEGRQVKTLILSRIDGKITLEKLLEWLELYFADKDYKLTKENGYTIGGYNRWLESGLAGG
jgi:hypothetical protein